MYINQHVHTHTQIYFLKKQEFIVNTAFIYAPGH